VLPRGPGVPTQPFRIDANSRVELCRWSDAWGLGLGVPQEKLEDAKHRFIKEKIVSP
jgi:hypothetical protein